ncbi:hypothetical protein [Nonlabens sp. MB-3u-79]|uniref:hypothetical protein n=1 Tax=Nonlabens sp. MB-3u-79 TaxID=2058134 RepID=UPI0012FE4DC0|nr:hypothetical protein [Nonlabens sp. MB-3u-79]
MSRQSLLRKAYSKLIPFCLLSYQNQLLPTQICERSKQMNLPTAYCLLKFVSAANKSTCLLPTQICERSKQINLPTAYSFYYLLYIIFIS